MTTINSQEDFLRALSENPQWKDAVRVQILGEELLQLPVRFGAFEKRFDAFEKRVETFITEQREFNNEITSFVTEQREFNNEMTSFVTEQREFNNQTDANFTRIDRRLDTLTVDVAVIKGYNARAETVRQAWDIALDLGLEYVRTLPSAELGQMAQAAAGSIPTNELRSFRRADLVIEATDASSNTHYIAAEISFTADRRDSTRAQRNAGLLTRFTGQPARAVVASVKNDQVLDPLIASGAVHWYSIDQRDIEPE